MSLDLYSWTSRDQDKLLLLKQPFETSFKQSFVEKILPKQFVLPSNNRSMQADQRFPRIESAKNTMFDPNAQQHHQPAVPDQQHLTSQQAPQQHTGTDPADKTTLGDFPFCYNSNMIQKGQQPQQQPGNGIEPNCNDKSAYRFDVSQPFSYNYALVNQMSLAAAASTATFKCDVCGLVFAHLSLLNHHKRIHSNNSCAERLFSCEICGATFTQLCDLKSHKLNSHPPTNNKCCNVNMECELSNSNKKSKYTETDDCEINDVNVGNGRNIGFSNTRDACIGTDDNSLQCSEIKTHPVKRKTLATITKCPKCNGSGIVIVGNVQNVVEKPFHCNICDSTFSRYSSLWSHRRLHTGEKPFKCELCGSTFARASSLKNHNRVHTGERPYKCNVCGMQFSQAHHLKSHERIHSGERPYECEMCGKTFARHSTLWNHRRIHTGEKPYRCEICGSAFHQATHLKNHAKVHTGEKPYRCDICDVGFSDRFALKRHRGIHEKYGQTGPNQPARVPVSTTPNPPDSWKQNQQPQQNNQPTQMDSSIYKCDSTSLKPPNQAVQQTQLEDIYKCNVPGSIAFPGCSRPPEK